MEINQIVIQSECLCGESQGTLVVSAEQFDKTCSDGHFKFVKIAGDAIVLKELLDGCPKCCKSS